jgi:hypothetical protein
MKNLEHSNNRNLNHLKLFFYLIPILGFFPSLWTLYHHGNQSRGVGGVGGVGEQECQREQLALSRLSVTLSGCWLLGYFLLGIGAESEFFKLRFLMLNTLLTSGYFLVSIWLMFRLSSGKSVRLPGFSRLAERVGKHLG